MVKKIVNNSKYVQRDKYCVKWWQTRYHTSTIRINLILNNIIGGEIHATSPI